MKIRSDLESMISPQEQILWRGKPQKKCFIFECIFNPMLFFALIWAAFDIFALVMMNQVSKAVEEIPQANHFFDFTFVFFAFHLMPVWIYLSGVFFSFRRYKNTEYIVTDKGIYVSGGVFTYNCQMKPFAELSNVNIHRGVLDQMFGVGDVVVTATISSYTTNSNTNTVVRGLSICDIAEYREVFSLVKQLQTDVYADTMYPNDLRPSENHGYNTKYSGKS